MSQYKSLRTRTTIYDGKLVSLLPYDLLDIPENSYTIVVGKNGVGKSRLLSHIAEEHITTAFVNPRQNLDLIYNWHKKEYPPVVIAVSTSPFDKFPSSRTKPPETTNYRYVGMKGESMYAPSSAIGLIASACKSLLNKMLHRRNSANFLEIFKALSFEPSVELTFKPTFANSSAYKNSNWRSDKYFSLILPGGDSFQIDKRYEHIFTAIDGRERDTAFEAMKTLGNHLERRRAFSVVLDFGQNKCTIDTKEAPTETLSSILLLLELNIIRLLDLNLLKTSYGELSLKKASSGEQCLFVMMLGIAGHIENGSLILIDEPEISLHPRWQEEFVKLLNQAFSSYQHCHFIVATHSPQIVSRSSSIETYIYSLTKNEIYPSKEFQNRSADYQLAELFDAPGLMNEYISRISFNLLAKLRAKQSVDPSLKEDLEKLLALKGKLSPEDPTIKLIDSVVELYKHYARDK